MQNKQKSYICEVSTIIGKESFINAKKVLNFIQSLMNENKVIKSLKAFHMFLRYFDCCNQSLFSRKRLYARFYLQPTWDFLNISLFPKFLSLKLFGNSWGNMYAMFLLQEIKSRYLWQMILKYCLVLWC